MYACWVFAAKVSESSACGGRVGDVQEWGRQVSETKGCVGASVE